MCGLFASRWKLVSSNLDPLSSSEPKLFQNMEQSPQFPAKCNIPYPKAVNEKRQLLGRMVSEEEAEAACSNWNVDEKKNCISDVLAMNDLELASGNGY